MYISSGYSCDFMQGSQVLLASTDFTLGQRFKSIISSSYLFGIRVIYFGLHSWLHQNKEPTHYSYFR